MIGQDNIFVSEMYTVICYICWPLDNIVYMLVCFKVLEGNKPMSYKIIYIIIYLYFIFKYIIFIIVYNI